MRPERTTENQAELPRRIDKLGVTGSSPVPPIEKSCKLACYAAQSGNKRSSVATGAGPHRLRRGSVSARRRTGANVRCRNRHVVFARCAAKNWGSVATFDEQPTLRDRPTPH